MRTALFTIGVASVLVLHVACGGDDSADPGSSASSGGASSGASSGGSSGASSSGGSSGASSSGSSGSDGGDGGSSGAPVTSCNMPLRVDTLRGVNGGDTISAAGFGDKWAVTWFQIGAVSNDALFHFKGRFFDGTMLKDEHDFGTYDYSTNSGLVSDGNGRAFVQRVITGSTSNRYILDYATGVFGAGSPFSGVNGTESLALAAIPGGGAISFYRNGAADVADRWLPADPTWKTTGLAGSPANANGLRVFANAAGKAVALWYSFSTDWTIHVATFDGANWATTATKVLLSAIGPLNLVEGGIYSNGDALVVYTHGADAVVHSTRLRASTGAFDPVVDVGTATNAATYPPAVIIDAMDRVTVAYLDNFKAMARRDVGAGFLQVQDLGQAEGYRVDLDRTTNNVFIVTYKMPTLSIRGVGPTSNTWTAAIPLNLGISNQENPRRQAATVFDSAGRPTVLSMMDAPGPGGLELFYAKCQ